MLFVEATKKAVTDNPTVIFESRSKCLAILNDYGLKEHDERFLLADALEMGCTSVILREQSVTTASLEILADKFAKARFLKRESAMFAVACWAYATGRIEEISAHLAHGHTEIHCSSAVPAPPQQNQLDQSFERFQDTYTGSVPLRFYEKADIDRMFTEWKRSKRAHRFP